LVVQWLLPHSLGAAARPGATFRPREAAGIPLVESITQAWAGRTGRSLSRRAAFLRPEWANLGMRDAVAAERRTIVT